MKKLISIEDSFLYSHLLYIYIYMRDALWKSYPEGICRWWSEFKSRRWLFAFHIVLISLGKVWIQRLSLQLWVNRRANHSLNLGWWLIWKMEFKPNLERDGFHQVIPALKTWNEWGCPHDVMVKALDCGIEFKLQSHYYIHFHINTLRKGLNPPYHPICGLNSITTVVLKKEKIRISH